MKIFISWSEERSRQVAELLSEWIQCVLQAVDPWVSSKDIDRGALWFTEITSQLSNTQHGIVCLTKANMNNPWILFEAGALAKGLSSSRVFTLLIDLPPTDVKDPLAQFNHTLPDRSGIYQLIRTINKSVENQSLKESVLVNVFETYWPQFESKFAAILENTPIGEVQQRRDDNDILNEILISVRGFDKRLRRVEENEYLSNNFINNPTVSASLKPSLHPLSRTMNVQIEDLDLSVRAFNHLKSKKVNTVDDLLRLDLSTVENPKTHEELRNAIDSIIF